MEEAEARMKADEIASVAKEVMRQASEFAENMHKYAVQYPELHYLIDMVIMINSMQQPAIQLIQASRAQLESITNVLQGVLNENRKED